MLDHGLIHQGHVREIRDVSTCTAQHVGAARRSIWRDVPLPWQRPRYQRSGFMAWRHVAFTKKKTYPLQTCYEQNMLSLLHAVCLKVLVFFFTRISCHLMQKKMVDPDRPQMAIWRTRFTCWIPKATDTLVIFITLCFSTTKVVTRTRLSVNCFVHLTTRGSECHQTV